MSLINRVLNDLSRRRAMPELAETNLQNIGVQSTRQEGNKAWSSLLQEGSQLRALLLGLIAVLLLVVGVWQEMFVLPTEVVALLKGAGLPESWLTPAATLRATAQPVVAPPSPAGVAKERAAPTAATGAVGKESGGAATAGSSESMPGASGKGSPGSAPPAAAKGASEGDRVAQVLGSEPDRVWSASPPVVLTVPSESPCARPGETDKGAARAPEGAAAGGEGVIWLDRQQDGEEESPQRGSKSGQQRSQKRQRAEPSPSGNDLLWQARSALLQGDLSRTGELLRRVPERLLASVDYRILTAAWYQQSGDYAQAAEEYRWLIEREPQRGGWWLGRAIALENMGRSREAMAAYLEAEGHRDLQGEVRRYIRERLAVLQAHNQP
ncbi:MAG: hypothetical protein HQM06_00320 [Magnetococcales bacterium]|nr:hypothetical protein [Magnetococcales bacterium]